MMGLELSEIVQGGGYFALVAVVIMGFWRIDRRLLLIEHKVKGD